MAKLWHTVRFQLDLSYHLVHAIGNLNLESKVDGLQGNIKIYDLACLLGEGYLWDDVLNCILEILWLKYCAQHEISETKPPEIILLPTTFFSDINLLRMNGEASYTQALKQIQLRLSDPATKCIIFPIVANSHFTAYKIDKDKQNIEYFDSLLMHPDADLIPMIRPFLTGAGFRANGLFTFTNSSEFHQGVASGSCGVAVLNWISIILGLEKVSWRPSHSQEARSDLLKMIFAYHFECTASFRKRLGTSPDSQSKAVSHRLLHSDYSNKKYLYSRYSAHGINR